MPFKVNFVLKVKEGATFLGLPPINAWDPENCYSGRLLCKVNWFNFNVQVVDSAGTLLRTYNFLNLKRHMEGNFSQTKAFASRFFDPQNDSNLMFSFNKDQFEQITVQAQPDASNPYYLYTEYTLGSEVFNPLTNEVEVINPKSYSSALRKTIDSPTPVGFCNDYYRDLERNVVINKIMYTQVHTGSNFIVSPEVNLTTTHPKRNLSDSKDLSRAMSDVLKKACNAHAMTEAMRDIARLHKHKKILHRDQRKVEFERLSLPRQHEVLLMLAQLPIEKQIEHCDLVGVIRKSSLIKRKVYKSNATLAGNVRLHIGQMLSIYHWYVTGPAEKPKAVVPPIENDEFLTEIIPINCANPTAFIKPIDPITDSPPKPLEPLGALKPITIDLTQSPKGAGSSSPRCQGGKRMPKTSQESVVIEPSPPPSPCPSVCSTTSSPALSPLPVATPSFFTDPQYEFEDVLNQPLLPCEQELLTDHSVFEGASWDHLVGLEEEEIAPRPKKAKAAPKMSQ